MPKLFKLFVFLSVLMTATILFSVIHATQVSLTRQAYQAGYDAARVDQREAEIKFLLDRIAFYESSYNVFAKGDYDPAAHTYRAYGLFQFHYATFKRYAKLSGHPEYEWKNPDHQIVVAEWMLRHGYGKDWHYAYNHALRDWFDATR